MSLEDVAEAIRECNEAHRSNLSSRNAANFMKDLVRKSSASENWPESVAAKRITGVQRTGEGGCFEFIPYRPDQTEPFPDEFPMKDDAPCYPVQSISIPLVAKTLGRKDESWLIQTAVNLRVVETHFAVQAKFRLRELALLQMGIKLRSTEIDALFLGRVDEGNNPELVLVTCEAKQEGDRLIPSQIVNQVQAVFSGTKVKVDTVVPIGLRAVRGVGYYLTEFEAVKQADAALLEHLTLASEAMYELCPRVKGI